jgi:hypothetical protein
MQLLGDGPGNIGPYSEFTTLILTLESLKVPQCPVFPILCAVVFVMYLVQTEQLVDLSISPSRLFLGDTCNSAQVAVKAGTPECTCKS